MLYFFSLNVTCFVLWAYAAALLPFGYFVSKGEVGQPLVLRVIAAVVILSIVAPWPYLRWVDRTVVLSATIERIDPVGPCDCVRLVVPSRAVRDASGFDVGEALEWNICVVELPDWLDSKADQGSVATEWEVTYASEYLADWEQFSYGLDRVDGRDALRVGDWDCWNKRSGGRGEE